MANIETQIDWRKDTNYYQDTLWALDSLYSYDDWSAISAIYESRQEKQPIPCDLLIQNINFIIAEHQQITSQVGESFNAISFGKAPMEAQITAFLVDTHLNYGKQYLMDAYKNKLRLNAVALSGKIPVLVSQNMALHGPILSMRVNENIQNEDTVTVVFRMLVLALEVVCEGKLILFDFAHGMERSTENSFVELETVTSQPQSSDPDTPVIKTLASTTVTRYTIKDMCGVG